MNNEQNGNKILLPYNSHNTQKSTKRNRRTFEISLEKMKTSWILFDVVKLNWFSNNYITTLSKQELYDMACAWAKKYNPQILDLLTRDSNLAWEALNIERCTPTDPKRITKFEDISAQIDRIYDDIWSANLSQNKKNISDIFTDSLKNQFYDIYKSSLDLSMTKDERFGQLKEIGKKL